MAENRPIRGLGDLPGELLLEVFQHLDYGSLAAVLTVNRQLRYYTQDPVVWRAVSRRTFSPGRNALAAEQWHTDFVSRMEAAREFLVRGTNDYKAAAARKLFSEMGIENVSLVRDLLARSDHSISTLLVDCQGYSMSNIHRLLPHSRDAGITTFLDEHHDRLVPDPRSEVYLLRMLLARHTGYIMRTTNIENYLRCAHLITYNSLDSPIFFFPPITHSATHRYELRSHTFRSSPSIEAYDPAPVVNWGVVETIHSLVKLYRDRMGESIPNFVQSRDDYEAEVPICSPMFDADLVGNWRGLYGYLDFRELEVLDSTRAFTPDFFDGISRLQIHSEESADSNTHPVSHSHAANNDFLASVYDEFANELNPDSQGEGNVSGTSQSSLDDGYQENRFVGDGASSHGEFHLHGSTMHLPGMEPGFKIVTFDEMYNADGLMPWVMEGVCIPSIGIVGRWRDRTEPLHHGIEGPYCLWRDRVKDFEDQEERIRQAERDRALGNEANELEVCSVRHLPRETSDMSYIIIEERSHGNPLSA